MAQGARIGNQWLCTTIFDRAGPQPPAVHAKYSIRGDRRIGEACRTAIEVGRGVGIRGDVRQDRASDGSSARLRHSIAWRRAPILSPSPTHQVWVSSFASELRPRLDFRLEHVPDHRAQLAIEPLEEHRMCQLLRPQLRITHPAVELLPKDPLPVVLDEFGGRPMPIQALSTWRIATSGFNRTQSSLRRSLA